MSIEIPIELQPFVREQVVLWAFSGAEQQLVNEAPTTS